MNHSNEDIGTSSGAAKPSLIVGTRGSELALVQTKAVMEALVAAGKCSCEQKIVKTQGDRKQGTAAAGSGDKRDWMHDLEVALISGDIDCAVHCGKDVPAEIHPDTLLIPVLERADSRDIFVGVKTASGQRLKFADLPQNAVVGTASVRRRAELKRVRPDLGVVPHRGNVPTRLRKLEESTTLSGIVIAAAGVRRLGIEVGEPLPIDKMLPAVNQGALCIQVRASDAVTIEAIKQLSQKEGSARFEAERACIIVLDGDCHSAVGCYAEVSGNEVSLSTRVLSHDGSEVIEADVSGPCEKAEELGRTLGEELLAKGAKRLLDESTLAGEKDKEKDKLQLQAVAGN